MLTFFLPNTADMCTCSGNSCRRAYGHTPPKLRTAVSWVVTMRCAVMLMMKPKPMMMIMVVLVLLLMMRIPPIHQELESATVKKLP